LLLLAPPSICIHIHQWPEAFVSLLMTVSASNAPHFYKELGNWSIDLGFREFAK